jgi:hypothetical protein
VIDGIRAALKERRVEKYLDKSETTERESERERERERESERERQ